MGVVYFYHLTRRPLEDVLPALLNRALAQEWRVVVRGTDETRLAWLDEKLWLGPEESFLPHGLAGGAHDAAQPVLLTTSSANSTAPCLMAIDGAEIRAEEIEAAERACILFDGGDEAATAHARGQWATLTAAGCTAQYWSEARGRWEMKAQHPKGA